jgi:hypothetical protein
MNIPQKLLNMSTTAAAQPILTIVKDEFTEVLTKGTLSPTTKPTNWDVLITEKALLDTMKTPSPFPEETQWGVATLYDATFPTLEEYRKFTVNRLVLWGNTMEYKLLDTLYVNHWNHTCTIKKLREQATALLEEANRISKRDMMIQHKIENHVKMITRSDLRQWIKKPQCVRVVTSPTPLPGPSRWPDYSHLATYGQNYSRRQYQCFQCGDPTHFKWDCPLYTCQTCNKMAPGHAPRVCQGHNYDDGIRGHYDIDGYNDDNLTEECWCACVVYICLPFNYLNKSRTTSLCHYFFCPLSFKYEQTFIDTMFLPPTSILEPIIYSFADKFYPLAILIKHHVWFLSAADLFISLDGILYGVHQSYSDQSPLFQEIIHYREADGISTNPYYPIPFDTLKKEIFNEFLHLLYFGVEQLEQLPWENWINIKWHSMDWHFPHITALIIWQFIVLRRWLLPPNLWMMANSLLVYRVMDEQVWQTRRAHGRTILVEESTDEEDTIIEDNES